MIDSLAAQVAHGQYAASELRAAENMMSLIAQWDLLRFSEKLAESEKGTASRFHQVPGFEPFWCGACLSETYLDFTEDPEGSCMSCGALTYVDMPAAA
ncbi:hypothetical protein [Streptomyces sp. AC495_CC817]|uniref:hypothetical protein n=1 Tax=Streptomyces sp. AC495_CC817 TaxID=2823900 RepID=UPI001C27ED9F|nr:hypothetical protein [Streptomyces sp. AC495_CC817]